jgi:CRISPR-associated protein Cmr5
MPNLEQKRAAYAWKCSQNCSSDYVNLSKSAPVLIMGNGLMQTLAFFNSKKDKQHHEDLNRHIFGWLKKRFPVPKADFKSVMEFLHNSKSLTYRQATEETMELLRWIRQFAAAVKGDKE